MRPRAGCGRDTADCEPDGGSASPVPRNPVLSPTGSARGTGGTAGGEVSATLSPGTGFSNDTRTTQLGHKPSQPSLGSGDPHCGQVRTGVMLPHKGSFHGLPVRASQICTLKSLVTVKISRPSGLNRAE